MCTSIRDFFRRWLQEQVETVPQVTGERRQAVSVTLETSYDDWCVAQLAKALGKQDDYAYFTKLAHNYRNVFNPKIGFMAPKERRWAMGSALRSEAWWRTGRQRLFHRSELLAVHVPCAA